jgi:hypothetical protein
MKITRISCPSCGAPLTPPRDHSDMECRYCGTVVHITHEPGEIKMEPRPVEVHTSTNLDDAAQFIQGVADELNKTIEPIQPPAPVPLPFKHPKLTTLDKPYKVFYWYRWLIIWFIVLNFGLAFGGLKGAILLLFISTLGYICKDKLRRKHNYNSG